MDPKRPAFLITIDTEGDDLSSRPRELSTRNAQWLPRFQQTCEKHGLLPTYLVSYEMAMAPPVQRFGRDVLRRSAGEIGMLLHAWNSPPLLQITPDDSACAPYLYEYPLSVMRRKIEFLTALLQHNFETGITCHRAGRWGLDSDFARILLANGFRVDCSVTPGLSWAAHEGGTTGGPDFRNAPREPYFLNPEDVCASGPSGLLEVPVTIVPEPHSPLAPLRRLFPEGSLPARALGRLAPPITWLSPDGRNLARMVRLLEGIAARGESYAQFTIRSSELMPGGSATFPTEDSINRLYAGLDAVFATASRLFRPSTLTAFSDELRPSEVAA